MARRKPIEIQCRDKDEWRTFGTCRASISGIGGTEFNTAGAVQASDIKIFTVKYNPDIADFIPQNCRILYDNKLYDVKQIDDFEERHIELHFKAEARYGR